MITRRDLLGVIGPAILAPMAVDPDVVPLFDALTARVAALEAALPGLTTDAEHQAALSQIAALTLRIEALEGGVVVPPPPPPPPPPPSGYAPPAGVTVTPSSDLAAIFASTAIATPIIFAAGVYPRVVLPRQSGRKMWSQTKGGAVLDGQGVTPYCLAHFDAANPISGVELHGFKIQNYRPTGVGHGMIGGEGMPGFLLEDLELTGSGKTGAKLSNLYVARRIFAHHNAEAGLSGGQAPGGMLLEYITANDNNRNPDGTIGSYTYRDASGSAAGIKIVSSSKVVARWITAHRNGGPGYWLDYCDAGNEIDDLVANDNDGPGLFYEISLGAIVRRPKISGSQRWASILITNSGPTITVEDADLTGLGIVILDDIRTQPRLTQGPIRLLRTLHTPGTTPVSNGYQHGIWVATGRNFLLTDGSVKFSGGRYKAPATLAFAKWNGGKTLAQWQAAGQELDGVLV